MSDADASPVMTVADGIWSVRTLDGRIVLAGGASTFEVPIEGPLRWARDGAEISFDEALRLVPIELHGWLKLAAVVALRHCISGIMLAVALPPGHHDWDALAHRASRVETWMQGLSRLDGVEVPPSPPQVDDGVTDLPV